MTFVHFKVAYLEKTYRFVPTCDNDHLYGEVMHQVAVIATKDEEGAFDLYWNDGKSNLLLKTERDFWDAVNFAESSGTMPPCVRLIIKGIFAKNESQGAGVEQEQPVEHTAATFSEEAVTGTADALAVDRVTEQQPTMTYSAYEMRKIRANMQEAKTVPEASSSDGAAKLQKKTGATNPAAVATHKPTPVAQNEKPLQVASIPASAEIVFRMDHLSALRKYLNLVLKREENLRLVVASFRSEHKAGENMLTFYFNSPRDFSLWEHCLKAIRLMLGLPKDCLISSTFKRQLTLTVHSVNMGWLLICLKHLTNKTEFLHVQIDNSPEISGYSNLLENSSVQQVTIHQQSDVVDQFTRWLKLVRQVRPSKLRVSRLEPTQELVHFLVQSAEVVESIWIGGLGCQGAIDISVVREMLSRNCSYLHIRDKETKVALAQADELIQFFQSLDKKVSLAIPTTSSIHRIDAQIGDYTVKKATASKFMHEKDLLLIEHVEIDPKAEDMC